MMTSRRGVAGVAAILLVAVLIQSASAAPCAVKGKVSGKAVSPAKGKFKGYVCWDGLVALNTKISLDWSVSAVTNYRYSVIGNYSTLSPATAKFGEISPAIGYTEKLVGTASAEELILGGTFPNILALARTLCSPDAGVGIIIWDPSTKALKMLASAKFEIPKTNLKTCESLP